MKKRSVSSVLAERIKQRRSVTPVKYKVRHVKFTPAEMADDPTAQETADWMPLERGAPVFSKPSEELKNLWRLKLQECRKGYIRLEADLQKKFRTESKVNQALREWLEMQSAAKRKKRKSA